MDEMYKRSLQKIKELEKIPTNKEWNIIAKEKCLLSYMSLQYIEQKSFYDICKTFRGAE